MSIDYSVEASVAIVVLDRADVLNAFDEKLGVEVLEVIRRVAADEAVRCIVITGAGRAFSSGEDLGALSDGYRRGDVPDLGQTLVRRYNPLIHAIRAAPKPVVAAINGVAAGAGASVALACDFRIASENAKLVFAFIKVGLVPDSGALWFLTKMVGASRAWQLAATGEAVTAEQALAWGLFHRVVSADRFDDEWRSFARALAAGPTRAFALTKSLLESAATMSLDDQLDLEVKAQTEAGLTNDHLEGVQAFLEKRRPTFEGS
jgi:2-(1,2-epoxy-1,2-dihydrophenyl)acetyl-CoA isomerase